MIKFSAPAKIHLLGEHSVVYGKPAIISAINLRVTVTISPASQSVLEISSIQKIVKKVIEPIIKKKFKIKTIPPFKVKIDSQIPIGAGLGSSAAISAVYIAALLSFLKINCDLSLINELAYEAEKVFNGNSSGGDNSSVVYGGLIWFRKETPDLKTIQHLEFTVPHKLAKNFILINTGKPKETTAQMVSHVKNLYQKKPNLVSKFLENQEKLVRELLPIIEQGDEKGFIRVIKEGEKNLESIDVASKFAMSILRKIEASGGAAKICGGGGIKGPTGILLVYHPNKAKVEEIAKSHKLPYFSAALGAEGLRKE